MKCLYCAIDDGGMLLPIGNGECEDCGIVNELYEIFNQGEVGETIELEIGGQAPNDFEYECQAV